MTIRRGEAWGEPGALPVGGVVVDSDAAAAAALTAAWRRNEPFPALGLLRGDLARTLGALGDRERLSDTSRATTAPIDIGVVRFDDRDELFVAHAVLRRSWWQGPILVIANAQFLGGWDVAPRAHPGDGQFDIVACGSAMTLTSRLQARRRLPSGTHLPHPDIAVRRAATEVVTMPRPADLWLDGVRVARGRSFEFELLPDAVTVVV